MKTLVLDLDETLLFSTLEPVFENSVCLSANGQEFYTALRPGLVPFLREMAKCYHCYIWSTGQAEYLAAVWEYIGVDGYTLWARDKCRRIEGKHKEDGEQYEKPLSLISKDLLGIVIVDNTASCFAKTPLNGILARTWRGDEDDTELEHLGYYLRWLSAQKKVQREHKLWRMETLALRSALQHK